MKTIKPSPEPRFNIGDWVFLQQGPHFTTTAINEWLTAPVTGAFLGAYVIRQQNGTLLSGVLEAQLKRVKDSVEYNSQFAPAKIVDPPAPSFLWCQGLIANLGTKDLVVENTANDGVRVRRRGTDENLADIDIVGWWSYEAFDDAREKTCASIRARLNLAGFTVR